MHFLKKRTSFAYTRAHEKHRRRRGRRKYSQRRRVVIIGFIHRSEHRKRTDVGRYARVCVKQRSICGAVGWLVCAEEVTWTDAVAIRLTTRLKYPKRRDGGMNAIMVWYTLMDEGVIFSLKQ